jgi:hypothetical protein
MIIMDSSSRRRISEGVSATRLIAPASPWQVRLPLAGWDGCQISVVKETIEVIHLVIFHQRSRGRARAIC